MDTSKRRTFYKLSPQRYWQKTCSQSKLRGKESHPCGIQSLKNLGGRFTMFFSQTRTVLHTASPSRKPAAVRGQTAVLLHHWRGEKLVGALKKTLLGNGWGCSSFLSFWLGFYSVKYKEKYVLCFPYQNLQCLLSCWMLLWPAVPKISW